MRKIHYSENGVYQYAIDIDSVEPHSLVGRFIHTQVPFPEQYAKLEITRGTGEKMLVHTYELYAKDN